MRHGRMHVAIHPAGDQGRHHVSFTFPRHALSSTIQAGLPVARNSAKAAVIC
jgi:hypothetical protein